MTDADLEGILGYWLSTVRPLEEPQRSVLNLLHLHEIGQARRLRQLDAQGPPENIDLAEWTRRATEVLRRPAEMIAEALIQQGYVRVNIFGCTLRCDGYDVFEPRSFIYSKHILSLYYLAKNGQTQVSLVKLANLSGVNLDNAGHYTKFLERQGLISKANYLEPGKQKQRTRVSLTTRGRELAEYLDSSRSDAHKSPLLPAWQAEIKELLTR